MRGVESQGMLCSARELGLSDDHSGLLVLDRRAPIGATCASTCPGRPRLHHQAHSNRADCLSVLGVAREVAALDRRRLVSARIPPGPEANDATFPVTDLRPDGCGRFTGRVIRDVNAEAATPEWMRQRLERAGQR